MTLIRPATAADQDAILRLSERLGDFPVPPWRTPGEIARADHHLLLDALRAPSPATLLLVAEAGRQVVGFMLVTEREDYFTRERQAHVEDLALAVEAEGKGLARRLIEAGETWARARGHRRITLNVWSQNRRALGLYQRLGFEPETIHFLKPL